MQLVDTKKINLRESTFHSQLHLYKSKVRSIKSVISKDLDENVLKVYCRTKIFNLTSKLKGPGTFVLLKELCNLFILSLLLLASLSPLTIMQQRMNIPKWGFRCIILYWISIVKIWKLRTQQHLEAMQAKTCVHNVNMLYYWYVSILLYTGLRRINIITRYDIKENGVCMAFPFKYSKI